MKSFPFIMLLAAALVGASCKSSKSLTTATAPAPEVIDTTPNPDRTPAYAPKKYGYKPSATRYHDLLHTRLELSFDWAQRHAMGKAQLRLKPHFYATDQLVLDAKGFDIHVVQMITGEKRQKLNYEYDGKKLTIDLERSYTREDTFELFIDYTAKPYERESKEGIAITSDLGLYFVNHDGSDPDKPRQIWTQGETQASSCWFPTIDATNERCSQEIYLTVDKRYITVSNGKKISSTDNGDGTRTDYWRQDLPHSPYLFALAIGEFAEVKDQWRGMPVNYYVEKEYEPYAKLVYGHTPDMIEFFSQKLNYDYPWDKYHQIVVRDFVSGAMENTGCVIFYGSLQHDANEHLDETNEDIIAHELFHHWFGDLVTCESWANLPLNESFASYGESLWFLDKYGKDFADHHLDKDLKLYLDESAGKQEPLIRYELKSPGEMFDRHSYQKGARVLHMLYNQVGEEAFWKSLELYLKRNAYTDVEIHELRLAFEDITGQDLNWFFNQWFLSAGHPVLEVSYEVNKGTVATKVSQVQDDRYFPVFRLPVKIQITDEKGKPHFFPVEMTTRDTVFNIAWKGSVSNVVFDADRILVGELRETKPMSFWVSQANQGLNYKQKQEAIAELSDYTDQDDAIDALLARLKDPFWGTRLEALESLSLYEGVRQKSLYTAFLDLASKDPHAEVRSTAVSIFSDEAAMQFATEKGFIQSVDATIDACLKDSSYQVCASALAALTYRDGMRAYGLAQQMKTSRSSKILMITSAIMMQVGRAEDFDRIMANIKKMRPGEEKLQILQYLGNYLRNLGAEQQEAGIAYLKKVAEESGQWYLRYAAGQSLGPFLEREDVKAFVQKRIEEEKNGQVRSMYKSMF